MIKPENLLDSFNKVSLPFIITSLFLLSGIFYLIGYYTTFDVKLILFIDVIDIPKYSIIPCVFSFAIVLFYILISKVFGLQKKILKVLKSNNDLGEKGDLERIEKELIDKIKRLIRIRRAIKAFSVLILGLSIFFLSLAIKLEYNSIVWVVAFILSFTSVVSILAINEIDELSSSKNENKNYSNLRIIILLIFSFVSQSFIYGKLESIADTSNNNGRVVKNIQLNSSTDELDKATFVGSFLLGRVGNYFLFCSRDRNTVVVLNSNNVIDVTTEKLTRHGIKIAD